LSEIKSRAKCRGRSPTGAAQNLQSLRDFAGDKGAALCLDVRANPGGYE
jgi:hypothetical protein